MEPEPIKVLGRFAKLDDQVAGEVLRVGHAALLAPQPLQCRFVSSHDDPGVRTTDEMPPVQWVDRDFCTPWHSLPDPDRY